MLDKIRYFAGLTFVIMATVWLVLKVRTTKGGHFCDCDHKDSLSISQYNPSKGEKGIDEAIINCNISPFHLSQEPIRLSYAQGFLNIEMDSIITVEIEQKDGIPLLWYRDNGSKSIRIYPMTLKTIKNMLCEYCSNKHEVKSHFIFYRWGIINYGYVESFRPKDHTITLDNGRQIKLPINCTKSVRETIIAGE